MVKQHEQSLNNDVLVLMCLITLTIFSGLVLSSSLTFATSDSVVDEVNITVPISCSLTGTGMNSHNTTIANGQYNSTIGETTLKAYCNDNEGFAIYAIGYTDNTDGKNVLTNSGLGSTYDIVTGTALTGNSQWAMKLETESSATYPISIQNSFDSFHTVPNDYTLVAKRTAGTDIGTNAEGSTLKSTYQAYISPTQIAGTYIGQVKYVLVHPHLAPEPILDTQTEVIFDGNGLTFPNSLSTNRIVYGESCEATEYSYVGNTPSISKTTNISNDGTMITYNTSNEPSEDTITINGADRLKIELIYGYDDNGGLKIYTGGTSSTGDYWGYFWKEDWENQERTNTAEIIVDSNTVTFVNIRYDSPTIDYYGYYAKIYPIYNEETEGASYEVLTEECGIMPQVGTYTETTTWNGHWDMMDDGYITSFYNEEEITWYLEDHQEYLGGQTLTLYAYNPNTIIYNGNNATAGTMDGFISTVDSDTVESTAFLLAPNYYKTGYGFAGWSTNQNATVNNNSEIYGPNEIVTGNELFSKGTKQATLYAVWVPTNGTMQNFNCSSLSFGEVTALSDNRDTNVYTVGKMQDGKCWMMENLRLDAANSLDSTKAQGYGGNFIGLADSEDENFASNSTVTNSLYNTSNITGNNQGNRFPRYNNNNIKIGGNNASGIPLVPIPNYSIYNNQPIQWYGYGNYYTWAAAIANTTDYTTETNTTTSICPSGWHLPTVAESDGLIESFGGTGSQSTQDMNILEEYLSYPNNFVFSGYYIYNKAQQYGDGLGEYWLGKNKKDIYAYRLYLQIGWVHPSTNNGSKAQGRAIRCIAN